MCRYHAIHFSCGHVDFALTQNCSNVVRQLQRINDPRQLLLYNIPFEDDVKCRPNGSQMIKRIDFETTRILGVRQGYEEPRNQRIFVNLTELLRERADRLLDK
ncbi:hypothetical protein VTO42DRAFT_4540 [Malbranchea cinnamomea]